MKTFLLSLLAIVTPAVCPRAAGEEEAPVPQVRLEVFIARLPEARAIELLPDLRDGARCSGAREQIVALIAKKEAELVDWPILTTKSGQRAVSENVHPVRYATQYSVTAAVPEAEQEKEIAAKSFNAKGCGIPEAFDTRDTGVTFEVEPLVQPDGRRVDVQFSSCHTTLAGWVKVVFENGAKDRVTVEQPEFQMLKTTTNIAVPNGGSMLVAFHKLQDGTQRVEVFILTATVLKEGPASGREAARERGKRRRR